MPKFIKYQQTYYNLDYLASVEVDKEKTLNLHFIVPSNGTAQQSEFSKITLSDPHYWEILGWLEQNSFGFFD